MSLATNVSNLATRVATEAKALRTLLNGNAADLTALTTTAKTNLVAAINELQSEVSAASGINDATTTTTSTWSSSKIDTEIGAAVDALVSGAPGALDTLNELAAAINDDASFAASVTSALALKAPLASPTFTGTPAAPTAAAGTNTTQVATAAFVQQETPNASDTVVGMVELATNAEVQAGTDTARAVTPAGLASEIGDYETTTFVQTFEAGLV